MSTDEKNRYVCEKLEICWHEMEGNIYHPYLCSCKEEYGSYEDLLNHINESRPNFKTDSGAVQLLREMEKREDWHDFNARVIGSIEFPLNFIDSRYITTPGKLLDAVVEWFQEKEK